MFYKSFGTSANIPGSPEFAQRFSVEHAIKAELKNEALVSVFQRAALNVAVVTSGVNALSAPHISLSIEKFESFVADVASTLLVLKYVMLDHDEAGDELLFAQEFIASANTGRGLFQVFAEDASDIGFERAVVIHRCQLGLTWRQTCRIAILALDEFAREYASSLPDIYSHNTQMISSLLAGALKGLHPCVDGLGQLFIPQLPQQRLWPRRAIFQSCAVHYNGNEYPAFINNISAGGAGLERVPPMQRGNPLEIELESGRILKGTVAWSSAPVAGVAFEKVLPYNDPILFG
jgi:hypothetical protein